MNCRRPGLEYDRGCRCLRCRVTHAAKERCRRAVLRRGEKNITDPAAARAHLFMLSKVGVGRKSVSEACDVSIPALKLISQGRRRYIRRETERRILGVTPEAFSGGSVIDSAATWKQAKRLLEEGFTRKELAHRLGLAKPELRWGSRITGRTAVRVDRLYRTIMAGAEECEGKHGNK